MRSRMSDGRRVLVSREVHTKCVELVAREGGPSFFSRSDWRARLSAIVAAAPSAPVESADDQSRAIEDELARSRSILNDRLRTQSVEHICLPWGISGKETERLLKRTGYRSAFANRLRGQHAVHAGDDPVLAEAPAECLHYASSWTRPAVLVFMTAAFPEDVAVAIVCHNNRATLAATLESLDAAGCPPERVMVVDAASTDGTVDWLRTASPRVQVRALATERRSQSRQKSRHSRVAAALRVPHGRRYPRAAGCDPVPSERDDRRRCDRHLHAHRGPRRRSGDDSVRGRQPALHLRGNQSLDEPIPSRAGFGAC